MVFFAISVKPTAIRLISMIYMIIFLTTIAKRVANAGFAAAGCFA